MKTISRYLRHTYRPFSIPTAITAGRSSSGNDPETVWSLQVSFDVSTVLSSAVTLESCAGMFYQSDVNYRVVTIEFMLLVLARSTGVK